jgi:LuxR family maltose regulon positive regulatory protein
MEPSLDSPQEAPLLATKLRIPPEQANLVLRPRLVQRLDRALRPGQKLILTAAPTGFGKTTLLSSWARRLDDAVGWLSLDEADNDLTRFLRYLTAALARAKPDLTAPPTSGAVTSLEAALVPVINQLADLETGLVLVLDDYHLIENAAIDEALGFLIDHAPPPLHVAIATGAGPSFPLPRWRARGQLTEMRADDLRFTRAETTEFL